MNDTLRWAKLCQELHILLICDHEGEDLCNHEDVRVPSVYFRPWLADRSQSTRNHLAVKFREEIARKLIVDIQSI